MKDHRRVPAPPSPFLEVHPPLARDGGKTAGLVGWFIEWEVIKIIEQEICPLCMWMFDVAPSRTVRRRREG